MLLLDPHVRDHLLRPGTLIPRLAASLLADRREGDPDRPLTFTTDDLPLDILDVKKASEVAQKRLMLIKSRAELQDAAVAMLNEQLPVAVTNAANIGTGRLQSALLEDTPRIRPPGQGDHSPHRGFRADPGNPA